MNCDDPHLYQTFVAGVLDFAPRRQSSLDAIPLVGKVCRTSVVNRMLVNKSDARSGWEIYALPPQKEGENYFRCVFGRSVRSSPLELR